MKLKATLILLLSLCVIPMAQAQKQKEIDDLINQLGGASELKKMAGLLIAQQGGDDIEIDAALFAVKESLQNEDQLAALHRRRVEVLKSNKDGNPDAMRELDYQQLKLEADSAERFKKANEEIDRLTDLEFLFLCRDLKRKVRVTNKNKFICYDECLEKTSKETCGDTKHFGPATVANINEIIKLQEVRSSLREERRAVLLRIRKRPDILTGEWDAQIEEGLADLQRERDLDNSIDNVGSDIQAMTRPKRRRSQAARRISRSSGGSHGRKHHHHGNHGHR